MDGALMANWSEEQYTALMRERGQVAFKEAEKAAKPSKYRNVKVVIDGEKFDSKREAQHWQALKLREKAGEITDIKRQVPFSLMCPTPGDDEEVCRYFADFTYRDVVHGRPMQLHVVDAKGKRTPMYQLKKKWLKIQDGVTIEEV
jgi:Protein of unknown function (DUF1064)